MKNQNEIEKEFEEEIANDEGILKEKKELAGVKQNGCNFRQKT